MTEPKNENDCHVFAQCEENEKKTVCYCLKKINNLLIRCFYNFGYIVGQRPLFFILIPFILSIVLSTGLAFIRYVDDPMVLFVPFDAPFIKEQQIVDSHFNFNYTELYDPVRITRHEGYSRAIISAKDGQSIFRSELWPEIMALDASIRNLSVLDKNGERLGYEQICAKWRGKCIQNAALNIDQIVEEVENGSLTINYPVMLFPFLIPQLLGGIKINETAGSIDDAKAITVTYFIRTDNEDYLKL